MSCRLVRRAAVAVWVLCCAASMGAEPAPPAGPAAKPPAGPPNIVWLVVEDMSADFACYGAKGVATPHVDRLAAEGTRFSRAFTTAPICSISRSALTTGRPQTAIGCHNHRSGSKLHPIALPEGVVPVPTLFRRANYHVNNLTVEDFLRSDEDAAARPQAKVAKTDYNYVFEPTELYDARHWSRRPAGKPFFVQVQMQGGKLRGHGVGPNWPKKFAANVGTPTDPASVVLPPYLPDDPTIRTDWAQYLDTVRWTDHEVGRIVERLRQAGELDRTVIFFLTDHGISHVRNKQFLYDGGTHVPLVVRGPGITAGGQRGDLVEHIDLAATSLALAGIPQPPTMTAVDLFAKTYEPRKFVFAARDRADETVDRIRSARSERFKYIRNFYPSRPYLQPNRYKDDKPIVQAMRKLHAEGKLTPAQALILAETRPREEFYDVVADPFELNNLAAEPKFAAELAAHREALTGWIERTGDRDRKPEPVAAYLDYVGADDPKNKQDARYGRNIELMLRWTTERPMEP